MSEQNAVRNELSLAQENAALRSRVAVLEEKLALILEQLAWLKNRFSDAKQSNPLLSWITVISLRCFRKNRDSLQKPPKKP